MKKIFIYSFFIFTTIVVVIFYGSAVINSYQIFNGSTQQKDLERLNKMLFFDTWDSYSNPNFGYSFSYPNTWSVSDLQESLPVYGQTYRLEIADGDISYIVFYKNPSKEHINGFLTNSLFRKTQKTFNGVVFTELVVNADDPNWYNGSYFISQDEALLLHVYNGYKYGAELRKMGDAIVEKVLLSLKPL